MRKNEEICDMCGGDGNALFSSEKECFSCKGTGASALDLEFQDDLVCPYCGYRHEDSWELGESGSKDCEKCGTPFDYETEVTRTFTSKRNDCRIHGKHDWKVSRYSTEIFVCRMCGEVKYMKI